MLTLDSCAIKDFGYFLQKKIIVAFVGFDQIHVNTKACSVNLVFERHVDLRLMLSQHVLGDVT